MRLRGSVIPIAAVDAALQEQMFLLMERYYANTRRAAFLADLAEKQWVILLHEPGGGELCGFSTQMLLELECDGGPVQALFSGDTIIDPRYWGDVALAHAWGWLAMALVDEHPDVPLYWFLISKGYKTYRFLPLFFREFYPRHDHPTPPWAQRLLDALGRHKFGGAYDPATGLVRGDGARDALRPGVADLTPERLRDPHVRFFAQRNPGHERGDELCCLAPLARANFTAAGLRVLGTQPLATGV